MKESTSATSPTSSNASKDKPHSNISGSSLNATTPATTVTNTTATIAAAPTTTTSAVVPGSTVAGTPAFRDTRAELAQLLKKKEEIEKSLFDIEEQIYAFETSYLKQTQDTGNCIRGWSSCLTNASGNHSSVDKSSKFRESDRLFSYSSATSYTLLGRDRLKREREKERRKTIRKNREIMQELSANKKSRDSEVNNQVTQITNEDPEEAVEEEDESTTSSEKPSSKANTNTSSSNKKRTKIKKPRNKRALSDSSQQSESRD